MAAVGIVLAILSALAIMTVVVAGTYVILSKGRDRPGERSR